MRRIASTKKPPRDGFFGGAILILSICIPTYSRRKELLATAAAVCDQLPDGVELVISDNGSADGTPEAVRAFAATRAASSIRLVTHAENVGFDQNLLDAVANARGRHCWLLGDDDLPRPGAIARILAELRQDPDLAHLLVNYSRQDAATATITKQRMIAIDSDMIDESHGDFFFRSCPPPSYFRRLGTNVITMSANVVERRRWLEAAAVTERFIGHNMIHVFIVAAMLAAGGRTKFVATPQLNYVCNNHRPWSNDVWQDYRIRVYDWLRQLGYDPVRLAEVEAEEITYRTWREFARGVRDRVLGRRERAGA
jgi:glycosyltransferase involved in cell wall biosynthesis